MEIVLRYICENCRKLWKLADFVGYCLECNEELCEECMEDHSFCRKCAETVSFTERRKRFHEHTDN